MRILELCLLTSASVVLVACAASGAGGREVNITQADDGCTPTSIEATPGEKLNLVVKNDSGKLFEVEGVDGTKLEEVIVPEGRTRSVGYTVPASGGLSKIKCYTPGGVSSIIEVRAGEPANGAESPGGNTRTGSPSIAPGDADTILNVDLDEFTVKPERPSVAAGRVAFVAHNWGEIIHEMYVLRVKDDGSLEVAGEIENVPSGESGSMILNLEPGRYQLACLITVGEAGSTVDHFKEGMFTEFAVE